MIIIYKTSKETQIRKDNKKKHILSAASMIFAERGYAGATVKDIVRKADASIGTFYFYFKSKENLFELLYDEFSILLDRVSEYAFDKKVINDVMGFCRSKVSELWIFQNNKGIAKAMMIEAAGLNPLFEKKRAEIFRKSNDRIERIFEKLKSQGFKTSYDAKTCALICNGTLYYVITDWLQGNCQNQLIDYAYPIITYNLNAFKLEYQEDQVIQYINEMMAEMEKYFKE